MRRSGDKRPTCIEDCRQVIGKKKDTEQLRNNAYIDLSIKKLRKPPQKHFRRSEPGRFLGALDGRPIRTS